MGRKFGFAGSKALAVALAGGMVVAGVGIGSDSAYAQRKKDLGNSPGFIAAAQPLLQKVSEAIAHNERATKGDAAAKAQVAASLAGAPAMLAKVQSAVKTPGDTLAAAQITMQIGLLSNDVAMAERGARAALATKLLDSAQTAQVESTLKALAGPATDPVLDQVNTYVQANNPAAALGELRRAVSAKPGQRAPSAYYQRAIQIADSSNNGAEALNWSAQWVEAYPSNIGWLAAAQVVQKYGSQEPQDRLDLYRFMLRSGAFNNQPRLIGREYYNYADMANLRGYYNEAVRAVDQGTAAGALSAAEGAQIRSAASGKIAADRASLAGQEARGRSAPDGVPALAAADLYLSFDNPAKAEELYKIAIQKGRVDKDRALTRLGIVQFDQGRYADARASFSQVGGQRRALARLWLALINTKAAGAA